MRNWQWIVLIVMALANVGLVAVFAPFVSADLQASAAAPPLPVRDDERAATPVRAPAPADAPRPSPTPSAAGSDAGAGNVTTIVVPTPPPLALSAPPPTPAPALPPEARITAIGGRKQKYSLSCEARSAADWAAYFGFALDEDEFLRRLPVSDNPDFGFVGDVNGAWGQTPPNPYGVHAGPVAYLLRQYGLNAHAYKGLTWDHLRAQIAEGKPVVVWVVGHVERGKGVEYTAADGRTTLVARYEHTVIVIGYTPDTVTVLDGSKIHTRSLSVFLDSWAALGNMAVTRGLIHFSK
jgi:uncharacterized protein YvpB